MAPIIQTSNINSNSTPTITSLVSGENQTWQLTDQEFAKLRIEIQSNASPYCQAFDLSYGLTFVTEDERTDVKFFNVSLGNVWVSGGEI